ncbi:hypothetical protein GCM10028808_49910 [Spirosoma migulaei]
MKIIHITDFHFNKKHVSQQEVLVNKLCDEINKIDNVSFVFFTGDLVDKGGEKGKNFSLASTFLFGEILNKTNIKKDQIIICCGNHDVNRNKEIPAIKAFVDNINNIDSLNQFVNGNKKQFTSSLENIKSFIEFQDKFYEDVNDNVNEIYSTHIRNIQNKKIGIATINTAWRSFDSDKDKGNLLFPSIYVEKIIQDTKNCDVKIILMHHPLTDLKDYVYFDLESKIYNHFHFLFSGHVHLDKVETHITGDEGIFCCISPSTLTYGYTDAKVGFTLLETEEETDFDAIVTKYIYDKRSESFLRYNPINIQVPLEDAKRKQINLRSNVRKRLNEEIDNANDLFLSAYDDGNQQKSFLELFTLPSIKLKSRFEISSTSDPSLSFNFLDFFSSTKNFVIFGKNKSGKTSILYKILLDFLQNYSKEKTLVFYLDCKEPKNQKNNIDIITQISRYYSLQRNKVIEIANVKPIRLLVDNYNSDMHIIKGAISTLIEKKWIHVILCTEEILSSTPKQDILFNFEYQPLYIHEITKARVRDLVKKWPNISRDSQQEILDKISKVFAQMNIPCNYWTVSLFLWVFEKTNNVSFHNSVELIQLYIDELLDKASLTLDKSIKIKYEELKEYLGSFAHYLLFNHGENVYSAEYSDIINFTTKYRADNIRFVIDVKEVVDLILLKGIIKKTYDGRYTFRLNGVFEYFLAIYIEKNSNFKDDIFLDSNRYISFGNEFEIYIGSNPKDKDFVRKVFEKTKLIFLKMNMIYGNLEAIDDVLQVKIQKNLEAIKDVKFIENELSDAIAKLTEEEHEELLDEMNPIKFTTEEVQLKEDVSEIEESPYIYERSLKILARVFRNSSIDDHNFNETILDQILLFTSYFALSYVDSMALSSITDIIDNEKKENNFKNLLEMNARFMPLIVQTFLFDALAQDNLERMILQKIDKVRLAPNNQFLLMLLYFLLIDLNPIKNTNYLRKLIDQVTIGVLRQTILMKLNTYIVFYSYGRPVFEKKIKDMIRELLNYIDPKEVEMKLQDLSRQSLIENMRNKTN